jgi:hypothetical protein
MNFDVFYSVPHNVLLLVYLSGDNILVTTTTHRLVNGEATQTVIRTIRTTKFKFNRLIDRGHLVSLGSL